jgi:hypothetical protein
MNRGLNPKTINTKMKAKFVAILIIVSIVSFSGNLFAQAKGSIKGRIIDAESKAGLPGVNVMVQGTYSGAATDADGNFVIPRLNPGDYTLQVSMIGYTMVQRTGAKAGSVALATSRPMDLGLPFVQWSLSRLRDAAIKQKRVRKTRASFFYPWNPPIPGIH